MRKNLLQFPCRIIPTRMGTRAIAAFAAPIGRDHPHAYGDKPIRASLPSRDMGSSPRVWGQGMLMSTVTIVLRIIPTRMGTSLTIYSLMQVCWDHPHAYGDKGIWRFYYSGWLGSSPRVWGQVPINRLSRQAVKDHPHAYGDKFVLKK